MYLDILLVCKNNEIYFKSIFPLIYNKLVKYNPTYYIYENNSTDKTVSVLENLKKQYLNVKVFTESARTYLNRYVNICNARNRLLYLYIDSKIQKKDSLNDNPDKLDFILLLDTNIIFQETTIDTLIAQTKLYPEGIMFSPFTCYYDDKNNTAQYYYDILAYNYGKFFKKPESGQLTFEMMLVDNSKNENDVKQNVIEIDTGFGGLVLIKRDYLIHSFWKMIRPREVTNPNISKFILCEHWYFCQNLKQNGKIYLVNENNVLWFMDDCLLNLEKNKKLCQYLVIHGYIN